MTIGVISGKLGHGKSKSAVERMRQYLKEGRRVVTNMDIKLEELMLPRSKKTIIRIPDRPNAEVFNEIGHGNPDSYDEDRNGGIFLDEGATWANARGFNDKGRQEVINWFLHARKLGWDVWIMCQSYDLLDKQIRVAVVDSLTRCVRFDRMKIPLIGGVLNTFFGGKVGYLPRFHMCVSKMVSEGTVTDITMDRWFFRGDNLHAAYDTRQIFMADYPHGPHSILSAWHLRGRHGTPKRGWLAQLLRPEPRPAPVTRTPLPLVALVARLPADERIKHWKRLHSSGAI